MFIVLYRPLPDGRKALGSVMLSPTNEETEFYETIETTGHEYEILDKYRGN